MTLNLCGAPNLTFDYYWVGSMAIPVGKWVGFVRLFMVFSAFLNYNIMLCIEFSSLRLKCDMGEFFSIALYAGRVHENKQVCWKRA